jgi:hypothetical protein
MNQLRLDIGLCVLAIALATLAVRRARAGAAAGFAPVPVVLRATTPKQRETADSLAEIADSIIENDPFRLSNQVASVAFDPHGDALGMRTTPLPTAPLPPPRPNLVLKGISGGPPWQAIVEGIPGQSTIVVTAGASFEKIVIRAVTRDSVVVQGADTTWVLRLSPRGQR